MMAHQGERIRALRDERQISFHEAKRIVVKEDLLKAIAEANSAEEFRIILRYIVELIL